MRFDVLQEMKESTIDDYEYCRIQAAEVAEELALRSALKRVSLEEAAKSPSISRYQWISYAVTGAVLIYFHDHLANYIWYIVIFLLIEIRTGSAAVHSRIDAILELERLRIDAQREEQKKSAEQGEAGQPPLAALSTTSPVI